MLARLVSFAIQLVVVVFGILTALFFVLRLSGDPAAMLAGPDASPQTVQTIRQELGLDQPLPVQYGSFLEHTVHLDFGQSFRYRKPALDMVLQRLPVTLELVVASVLLSVVIAAPIGILSALRRGHADSRLVMIGAAFGQAMPNFWLGIVLILIFAVGFRLVPSFGSGDLKHAILPVVTLAAFLVARQSRLVRSEMLDVLSQDYVRTARTKGLLRRVVLLRHAFRNVLIAVITVMSVDFSILLGASVVVETVFTYNGMAQQLYDSVTGRDYPVVLATVFVVAVLVVLANLLTDMAYQVIDPRVREAA
ncbi:MAG: ABC transporter permease [Chloroflexi bacterium]|nr:ABC transporter permease [Chloroflexota bacterium]